MSAGNTSRLAMLLLGVGLVMAIYLVTLYLRSDNNLEPARPADAQSGQLTR